MKIFIISVFLVISVESIAAKLCTTDKPQEMCNLSKSNTNPRHVEIQNSINVPCHFPIESLFDDSTEIDINFDIVEEKNYFCIIENEQTIVLKPFIESGHINDYKVIKTYDLTDGDDSFEISIQINDGINAGPISTQEQSNIINIDTPNGQSPLKVNINDFLKHAYKEGNNYQFLVQPPEISEINTQSGQFEITYEDFETVEDSILGISDEFGKKSELKIQFRPQELFKDDVSMADLKIEIAMIRKLRGDEVFIKKDTLGLLPTQQEELKKEASKHYSEAISMLESINLDDGERLSKVNSATKKLLESDIQYRQKLLDHDVSFWGGYRFLTPTTPHHEWLKIRELVDEFENIHDRMQRLSFSNANTQADVAALEAEKAKVMGQISQLRYDTEKANISKKRAKQQIYSQEWMLEQISDLIGQKIQQMDKLAEAQDSLESMASAQLNNLVASSTGIPIDSISNIIDGNVEGAIIDVVATQLKDSNSDLSKQLSNLSESSSQFIELGRELQETYNDVHELRQDVDYIAATIRDPSISSLIKSGEIIYSNLPSDVKTNLDNEVDIFIDKNKPLVSHLQSYYRYAKQGEEEYKEWKKFVERTVDKINDSEELLQEIYNSESRRLIKVIETELVSNKELAQKEIESLSRSIIGSLPKIDNKNEDLILQILSIAPMLLDHLEEDFRNKLPKLDNNSLVQLIKEGSNTIKIIKDEIQIIENGRVIAKEKINKLLSHIDAVGELRIDFESLKKLTDEIRDSQLNIKDIVLEIASPEIINEKLQVAAINHEERFKKIRRGTSLWKIVSEQPDTLKEFAHDNIRSIVAASKIQPTLRREASAPSRTNSSEFFLPGDTGLDPKEEMLAKAALNAAFPGAGTALALAQTWAAMDANAELNEKLSNESLKLMADYQQILTSNIDSYYDQAIANTELQREIALKHAAVEQRNAYMAAIDTKLSTTKDADKKIRLYRPFYFYMAESLRSKFDYFDRSLALWSGNKDGQGYLFQAITENPQNIRLALDSEIQLFDWLNRDRESTKTDPFFLYIHWKKILSLINDHCADGGCKPGSGKLGDVAITSPKLIFNDLLTQSEKTRFDNWKEGNRRSAFVTTLILNPADKIISNNHINTRIIDVNIVAINDRNQRKRGDYVSLTHLGDSIIPVLNENGKLEFRKERFLKKRATVSNQTDGLDKLNIEDRFDFEDNIAAISPLKDFEGYGLYGIYELEINDIRGIKNIDDFEIQFAYSFMDPINVYSERSFLKDIDYIMGGEIAAEKVVYQLNLKQDSGKNNTVEIDYNEDYQFIISLLENNKELAKRKNFPVALQADIESLSLDIEIDNKSDLELIEEVLLLSRSKSSSLSFNEAQEIVRCSKKPAAVECNENGEVQ